MPLQQIIQADADTIVGIWDISETAEELKWKLQWGQDDIRRFRELNDAQRGLHWLSSRVLLRTLLNTSQFIDLQVDEYGKPYLNNFEKFISISHSARKVAVGISTHDLGVDIQQMTVKVEALASKFANAEELTCCKPPYDLEQMHVIWCAKEALYKLYGKKKLDFKENLILQPFAWKEDRGELRGSIHKGSYNRDFIVHFSRLGDYILAYVIDNSEADTKPILSQSRISA